jgi:hypothetical protein
MTLVRRSNSKTQAAVEKAERDVQAKLAGVKSADSSLISETIRQEVAKVFAPFKQDTAPEVSGGGRRPICRQFST